MENQILIGDCAETLKTLPDNSIDCIVTDPPYGYNFMGLDWDKALPSLESLKECCRVLKPGAFGFFMCSPRQDVMSRMIIRLQDAGFEINFTSIYWVYTTGFPKAMDISKLIDKQAGAEREIVSVEVKQPPATNCYGDYGVDYKVKHTAPATDEAKALGGSYAGFQPKPATEPILVVMKPLSEKNYLSQSLVNGKGCTWLDDCRIPWDRTNSKMLKQENINYDYEDRFPANILVDDDSLNDGTITKSQYGDMTRDIGSYSRFFNIDAWFKHIMPQLPQECINRLNEIDEKAKLIYPFMMVPKPTNEEKNKHMENKHLTVKPIKLMMYLITMGSREGDVVLDPFCGSGTTLEAATFMGRKYVGCELDAQWQSLIEARAALRGFQKHENMKYVQQDIDKWA